MPSSWKRLKHSATDPDMRHSPVQAHLPGQYVRERARRFIAAFEAAR
jgi:hypothetical protein